MLVTSISKNRLYYADVLRVLATFAVILLHVSASISVTDAQGIDADWFAATTFNSMSRWCVPMFILLSGMLLLDPTKINSPKEFFKKRFSKILWPFLFWSFIYQLRYYRNDIINIKSFPLYEMIEGIIKGPVSYHLWFIYLLIVLYLLVPILKDYLANKSQIDIENILKVWFGIILFQYICKYVFLIDTGIHLYVEIICYAGYLMLGYYIQQYDILIKLKWSFVFLILLFTTVLGTFLLKYWALDRENMFYDYLSPSVILMTIAVFYAIKNSCFSKRVFEGSIVQKIISYISKISYGIYLVHILILSVTNTQLHSNATHLFGVECISIIAIPVTTLFIFLISTGIIALLSYMPVIKRITY